MRLAIFFHRPIGLQDQSVQINGLEQFRRSIQKLIIKEVKKDLQRVIFMYMMVIRYKILSNNKAKG